MQTNTTQIYFKFCLDVWKVMGRGAVVVSFSKDPETKVQNWIYVHFLYPGQSIVWWPRTDTHHSPPAWSQCRLNAPISREHIQEVKECFVIPPHSCLGKVGEVAGDHPMAPAGFVNGCVIKQICQGIYQLTKILGYKRAHSFHFYASS